MKFTQLFLSNRSERRTIPCSIQSFSRTERLGRCKIVFAWNNKSQSSLVSTIYGTDLLDPGSMLLMDAICCSNIPKIPSTINAKSPVRCCEDPLSPVRDVFQYTTHHLRQKIPKSVGLQCRRRYLDFSCGNISSTSTLKIQQSTKDLEGDADEVSPWVLPLEYEVVIWKSASDTSNDGGV